MFLRWYEVSGLLLVVIGFFLFFTSFMVQAQQMPAPPPNYQELLERSLTRESSANTVCTQRQEDLVKYFQAELRKRMDEIDVLKKQATPAAAPAPAAPATEGK